MKKYFAYIRVSTPKQGVKGVSLQEQRADIVAFAKKHDLQVTDWFEERQSAAKAGRAIFRDIIRRLNNGEADGLIIHKIDRSARNLRDWGDIGFLIDNGVNVQVAVESFDLLETRGGRLQADIQAVVAADYSRNLRHETLKGQRGRLKQGLTPWSAPRGYLNNGGGKPKTIDPVVGPLVKQAFELYSTGRYSLDQLRQEMRHRGLTASNGNKLALDAISKLLNNPFYCGVILVRSTGQSYKGVHEPLVSKRLFSQVQDVLSGKRIKKETKHSYHYRRAFKCALCGYSLIGEKQKGHVYYRCHTKTCPTKCVREDVLTGHLQDIFSQVVVSEELIDLLGISLSKETGQTEKYQEEAKENIRLQVVNAEGRIERLTDLFIDGQIAKEVFDTKRNKLILQLGSLKEKLESIGNTRQPTEFLVQFLEQAKGTISSRNSESNEFSRSFLISITSNRTVSPESVDMSISYPWSLMLHTRELTKCAHDQNSPRTIRGVVLKMLEEINGHIPPEQKP